MRIVVVIDWDQDTRAMSVEALSDHRSCRHKFSSTTGGGVDGEILPVRGLVQLAKKIVDAEVRYEGIPFD